LKTIKVNFGFFWPGFDNTDNYFTRILSKKYIVEISEEPDLYFFTHAYNNKHDYLKYKCHCVFIGFENERANWDICDYVLDSDYDSNIRHKRWPIWASWNPDKLAHAKDVNKIINKKKFACMVVSNGKAKERIEFFHLLSKYKKVDSGGRYLNNIGAPVENKMEFIQDYKFVISFENSCHPGYTTEKLIEPMWANSIPIYWGNPRIAEDFNTESFVNVNQFSSYEEAVDYIIDLDQNDDKLLKMAQEPWFRENTLPREMSESSLEAFFDFVVEDMTLKKPVALSEYKRKFHKIKIFNNKIRSYVYRKLEIEKGFR
jgi:hypothetical protein